MPRCGRGVEERQACTFHVLRSHACRGNRCGRRRAAENYTAPVFPAARSKERLPGVLRLDMRGLAQARSPDPCRLQSPGPPRQRKLHAAQGPTPASAHSHAVMLSCLHEGRGPGSWAMLNHVHEGQRAAILNADFRRAGSRCRKTAPDRCRIARRASRRREHDAALSRVRADKKAGNDFSR